MQGGFVEMSKKSERHQILLYVFFGGLTFGVSMGSFMLFNLIMDIHELLANIFSWIAAVLFAFATNRKWVFEAPTNTCVEFIKQMFSFFTGRIMTLFVEEIILFLFITILEYNSLLVKIPAQMIVIVINYIISKRFVFGK